MEENGGQRDQRTFEIMAEGRWLIWLRTTRIMRNGNKVIPLTPHLENPSANISRVMAKMKKDPNRSICASQMSRLSVVTL
jgi:hypothetical protein